MMRLSYWVALAGLVLATPAFAVQMFIPYPEGAKQRREHGTAVAMMTINADGEITRCIVSRSSGSAELDAATCPLVVKDRHYPKASPSDPLRLDSGRVTWIIPEATRSANDLPIEHAGYEIVLDGDRPVTPDGKARPVYLSEIHAPLPSQFQPGFEPVRTVAEVVVSPQLKASACSIPWGSGYPDIDAGVCGAILKSAVFWVQPDKGAKPRKAPDPSLPAVVLVSIDYALAGSGKSSLLPDSRGTFGSASPIQNWSWITGADYPLDAVQQAAEGVVGAELHVAAGRAIYCEVVESSGNKSLDQATCRITLKRGIFTQAHDLDGKPLLGIMTYRMNWVMPDDAFPAGHVRLNRLPVRDMDITLARIPTGLTASTFALRYLVDESGKALRCEADASSGVPALDAAACKATIGSLQFTKVRDSQGQPLRSVQTKRIGITLQQ